jgi:hypothetical protein
MSSNPKYDVFIKQYPNLFKEYPRSGFSVGEGWFNLLHTLCPVLEGAILSAPPEIQPGLYVAQVKEKFGGLRFYMNQETPYMSGAIALAENMSYSICEMCGKPGQLRNKGWARTLCDKHHKEREKKQAAK